MELSQAEINFALGKPSTRISWSKEEIELVKNTFRKEIEEEILIDKNKIKLFLEKNESIMNKRSTHLVIQWINNEKKRLLKEKNGIETQRTRWSIEEKQALKNTINHHINENTYPSTSECSFLLETNECLHRRNSSSIKTFMYNIIKKRKTI